MNKARLAEIAERNRHLELVVEEAKTLLSALVKDAQKYKPLLSKLIVQGCCQLLEDEVSVRCRKDDRAIVESVVGDASRQFSIVIQQQTGTIKNVKLSVDKVNFLPPSQIGGVILTCLNGLIRVDNSLQTRLSLLCEQDKPNIRKLLFT